MPAKLSSHFPAATIAEAAGTYKRAVHRRALRENWQREFNGNQFVFAPPRKLLAKCRAIARLVQPRGLRLSSVTPERRAESLRIKFRMEAVLLLAAALDSGEPHEAALRRVAHVVSFQVSPRSLRRWFAAFEEHGVSGLAESKRGVVGRKPEGKP